MDKTVKIDQGGYAYTLHDINLPYMLTVRGNRYRSSIVLLAMRVYEGTQKITLHALAFS